MRDTALERWSRGDSCVHRRDPRAKLLALLALLVALATAGRAAPALALILLAVLTAGFASARLPIVPALTRAAAVFSFSIPFAALAVLAGDSSRAAELLVKSYVSGLAVVFVVATTRMPALLHGLESSGVPRFLLMVVQFVYRYLFVIGDESRRMRIAAQSRGGAARAAGFRAAAGAVGALFARSYARAEEIHRAMLARGFSGDLPSLARLRFTAADAGFAIVSTAALALARWAAERLAA